MRSSIEYFRLSFETNSWLLVVVGNALKFTLEGTISVHIRVASDPLKASMMVAHAGKKTIFKMGNFGSSFPGLKKRN